MVRSVGILCSASLIVLLSLPVAAEKPTLSEEEKAAGFELLFNGENLDGWIIQGLEGERPKIEDGVMKMHGWDWWAIISKKQFKDFILRCDVLIEPKGNTGILFHTPEKEVFISSPEITFRDDAGEPPSKESSGAIYNVRAPKVNPIKPAGEWNQVEITVKHNHLKAVLNGEVIHDVDLGSVEGLIHKQQEGGIALQHKSFKHKAQFKNVRIKKL